MWLLIPSLTMSEEIFNLPNLVILFIFSQITMIFIVIIALILRSVSSRRRFDDLSHKLEMMEMKIDSTSMGINDINLRTTIVETRIEERSDNFHQPEKKLSSLQISEKRKPGRPKKA